MADLTKKDLLEIRLAGNINQVKIHASDSSSSRQATADETDASQKSLNDNDLRHRSRKRKSKQQEVFSFPSPRSFEPTTPITPLMISTSMTSNICHAEPSIKEERESKYLEMIETAKEWIKNLLIKEKKIEHETMIENSKKLGNFVFVRKGTQFVEEWQQGSSFKMIEDAILENNRMKDELERAKKLVNKKKASDKIGSMIRSPTDKSRRSRPALEEPSAINNSPLNQTLSIEEFNRYEELFKIRQTALRKEEADLNNEKSRLIKDRDIHIKTVKRLAMEEISRFNGYPLIGKGGFSEVHKAFDFLEYRYVACKIHQLNSDWRDDRKANYIKHAMREFTIHKSLDHPNIVKLYDVFEIDNDSFATILEYCDGDDLDSLIKQYRCIPEREARFIIIQVSQALRYLNERKPSVIHYDLKPGNILLLSGVNSWHVKLTDFGLSKILPPDDGEVSMDLTSPGAGTYWYLPPECFLSGLQPSRISSKVDVWSIGVIFFQCLFGKKPFGNELSQTSILEQNTILKATSVVFPTRPIVSNEAKEFISACLAYSKESRIDVIQMSELPYLKSRKSEKIGLPPLGTIKNDDNTDINNSLVN